MSFVDWAKEHPVIAGVSGVAAAGALTAGVVFSGVFASQEPVAEPEAPVATASVNPTASASEEPSASPSAEATPSASATPSATASASATDEPAKSSQSAKPTPSATASRTTDISIEEMEGIGDGPQEPTPNENDKEIAEAFGKAYANGGVGKSKWIKAMKPHSSPQFLAGFSGIDDQWIPVDELDSVNVTEDGDYEKIYDLRFKSGMVESVKLTLAEDYQTWRVSDFGYTG